MTAGASADTMLRAIPRAACGSIDGRVPAGTPVMFAQMSWAVLIHVSTWVESSARRKPTAAIDATTATPITIRIRANPPVVITMAAHPGTLRASSHSCARRATIAASAEKVASANRPPASAIPTVTTMTAASMIAGPRSSRRTADGAAGSAGTPGSAAAARSAVAAGSASAAELAGITAGARGSGGAAGSAGRSIGLDPTRSGGSRTRVPRRGASAGVP